MIEPLYLFAKLVVAAVLGFCVGWTFYEYDRGFGDPTVYRIYLAILIIAILLEAFVL